MFLADLLQVLLSPIGVMVLEMEWEDYSPSHEHRLVSEALFEIFIDFV